MREPVNSYKVVSEKSEDTKDLNKLHAGMVASHPEAAATVILTEVNPPNLTDLLIGTIVVGLNTSTGDPIVTHYALRVLINAGILDVASMERKLDSIPSEDPTVRAASRAIVGVLKKSFDDLLELTYKFDKDIQKILVRAVE